MTNILTVYYSRKGENYFGGAIRSIEKGNTEILAEAIADAVGSDLFEIDTVKPYSSDYTTCTKEAQVELRGNARPELKEYLDDLEGYDIIFVGYPNWCGTCPMAVFSFLEHGDLTGKRIIPFCTNEGSGMGRSEADIRRLCPEAVVEKGLSVKGSAVESAGPAIEAWLKENGVI